MVPKSREREASLATILSHHEVVDLRDHIIWPVVDSLAGESFVELASPESNVELGRTFVYAHQKINVGLDAYISIEEIDDDGDNFDLVYEDSRRVCTAIVTLRTDCPDMIDALVQTANNALRKDVRNMLADDEEFTAWQTDKFYFSDNPESPVAYRERQHELQQSGGEVLWCDIDMGTEAQDLEDESIMDDEEHDELWDLDAKIESQLTVDDRSTVLYVLGLLGLAIERQSD